METIDSFSGEYRWLSNFWPCPIFFEGIGYPSTEHAYQAAKSTDEFTRRMIAALPKAGQTKRFAKEMKKRADWDEVKLHVMEEVLRYKFAGGALLEKLLATGNAEIIEGNTWGDVFWGVCNGVGENNLGKLLMKIRAERRTDDKCKAHGGTGFKSECWICNMERPELPQII